MELIPRFSKLNREKSGVFLSHIFTEKELIYCFSRKMPAQHLAVRFAAKEAIIKAISSLSKKTLVLNEIEIVKKSNGYPEINLNNYNIRISLSHCDNKAIAFVVVEKK